jgi:hypothetical protein
VLWWPCRCPKRLLIRNWREYTRFIFGWVISGLDFSGPRLRSWSFCFCVSILLLAFLSVHCVSPHRRSHKPRRISTLKTKYHLLCLPPWPQPIIEYGSSIQGRSMVPRLKTSNISPKEKYFWYLRYLYHLFARGRATSKHGGGGRYDAIFRVQRGAIKKSKLWCESLVTECMTKKWMNEKKNERKKERGEKEKKYEYVQK